MKSYQQFLALLLIIVAIGITPSSADDDDATDDNSTITFDDLSSELEASFNCSDGSILDILDGDDTVDCEGLTDTSDALDEANYNETEALESLLYDLLDCDDDTYEICECDDYVPETIIYADDSDEVEGYDEGFVVFPDDYLSSFGDDYDLIDVTYYIHFTETGEYDQYGCARQEVSVEASTSWDYVDGSTRYGTAKTSTGVIRSDPACVETIVADVNDVIQLYSEIEDDEVEEEVSSFNSTYLLYGLGGILGFGTIGVCCLALSASKVDAVNKSKSRKKKQKKSKSKRELKEKEESRKRRRDKKKRCVRESIV